MDVAPIRTERLDLLSMSPELIEAVVAGDARSATALLGVEPHPELAANGHHAMRLRLVQMATDPAEQEWLLRAFVLRHPQPLMVGFGGFHSRPDALGAAELGYNVFPEHRRQGYAREAVGGLMDWATAAHGVRRFICSISPTNTASLALARGFGFVETGSQMDEIDGLELIFERTLPAE